MTLPGMPARYGDPGVHICGPEDIAPSERENRLRSVAPVSGPPAAAPLGVWLVLTRCARCARLRSYCPDHRLDWFFRHLAE